MQQTRIDQWLRRKYLFVTSIYCNTLPIDLPTGLEQHEAGEESGGRFRYKLITRDEEVISETAECFRMQNITYTSRVYDRKTWYSKYLTNRQKSVTFQGVWVLIFLGVVAFAFSGLPVKAYKYLMADEQAEEEVVDVDNSDDEIKISTVDATVPGDKNAPVTVLEIDRQK